MQGVPHHMINCLEPSVSNFTVIDFRNRALSIMEDIWNRQRLPVIAGGTSYYVESILWDNLIADIGDVQFNERSGFDDG